MDILKQIGKLLEPVGAGEITSGGGGEDIRPLLAAGVPGMSERAAGTHYFDWHHSEADTLDKVDLTDFRKSVAALAVMGSVASKTPRRQTAHPALAAARRNTADPAEPLYPAYTGIA
jgi:hypothetical protein